MLYSVHRQMSGILQKQCLVKNVVIKGFNLLQQDIRQDNRGHF